MLNKQTLTKFLTLALFLLLPSVSWAWFGKVVGVADGDTIKVLRDGKQEKISLYVIDCPEKGHAFGKKAKQFTSKMVYGKVVEVHRMDTDRYGRTVALVRVDGVLLNEALFKEGLALVYRGTALGPFASLGINWKPKPMIINMGSGLTLVPQRLGSLGGKGEAHEALHVSHKWIAFRGLDKALY